MVLEYLNVQDSFWNYVKEILENLNLKFAFKTRLIYFIDSSEIWILKFFI